MSLGQNVWYQWKGLVTRNTHAKYQSPISYGVKDMTKVKVFWKFSESRSKVNVKVKRSINLVQMERSFHKKYTCKILKPYLYRFKRYGKYLKFIKVGQRSMSRSQGQKVWYQCKGLVTRNALAKYQSPVFYGVKDMAKVKVFATDRRTGQKLYAPESSIPGA